MELYMVRHGKTEWNKLHKIQGREDIPLSEEGKKQAANAYEKLKNINFTKIYTSPLIRCIQTLQTITNNNYIVDERLIERGFGALEGTQITYESIKKHWDYKLNTCEHGMESLKDLLKRLELFNKDLLNNNEDDVILIVSHACSIKAIYYNLIGYDDNTDFLDFYVDNCDVVKINIENKKVKNIEIM